MGYLELIGALRAECEEKVRKIWEEAEAEAEKIRAESSRRMAKVKADYERDLSGAVKGEREALLSEAWNAARTKRLVAEGELSARLYGAAKKSLRLLRDGRYEAVFRSLAAELPLANWHELRVAAEDKEIAKGCFPGCEIFEDKGISGGFTAVAKDGGLCVVNTFEKRLERAWSEMLPKIMEDLYETLGRK